MPISDTKKVQSLINMGANCVVAMRAQNNTFVNLRAMYVAQGVDPTGTPLEGNTATLVAAMDALEAALLSPVFDALIAAYEPTHKGNALD